MGCSLGSQDAITNVPVVAQPVAKPVAQPVEQLKKQPRAPFAKVCDDHGLEDHGNHKGGSLTAAHIKHLDKETFKGGLHKPNFHEDGMHKPVKSGEKEFETGFHYLLHCHDLGGKNADGGFGGPLCRDPYGAEVRGIVDRLLKEAQEDKTLCYNNFKCPCPMLTKEQVAICKGSDYGDKTKKLAMGPLPWPNGCPEPGYVPKSDPLHGRWITVQGGQKEFIKEAIASGMLGKAEADKIIADTDHHQTGGMYLRINQHGEVCTVDASVAKFARAKRTWKSGHYFYEPLVSGGNLFGVWVLPEEYRKIGFFWEMESGRCFRIERRAFAAGPYMFLRQATEVNGKVSFVFYVKVDNDPNSNPIPLQSRDYTALAGQNNCPDNLGNPYPCTGKDLDYPIKRDTWLDTNKEGLETQKKLVAKTFARISEQEHVGMGWSSSNLEGVTIDGLWEALVYKARNPQEFMDVSDVVVQDRSGFLWRSMYVKASKKKVIEHIYCNERKGEMVYRKVDFNTKRELEDERVIAVKEDPVRMEFFHRHKSDGYRSYWAAPVTVVQGLVDSLVEAAKKLEYNSDKKVGLGVHSAAITNASHDALWKAMIECIREPGKFMDNVTLDEMKDCDGFVKRTTTANGKTISENIYAFEANCEVVYRLLDDHGKETDIERVVALRSHPLEFEFHCRNRKDGFRVDWALPKEHALAVVDAYIKEAQRFDKTKPKYIGYGISSDPITDVNYDSLFIAIEKMVMDPSLAEDVDSNYTKINEYDGFVKRTYKPRSSKEVISEKVTIFEELGEVVFCKLDNRGRDGDYERVIAVHTGPLRMELYERNTTDDMRVAWKESYATAVDYFTNIVTLAKKIQTAHSDVVGYGISSKPLTGCNADTLWRAMEYCVRNPAKAGMNVGNVKIEDRQGYMSRSMDINDKPGKPTVSDNVYIDEASQEILFRVVADRRESVDERVFCLRTKPLRMEMFSRHVKDKLRAHWSAPRSVAKEIFDECTNIGQLMYNDPNQFERKYGKNAN